MEINTECSQCGAEICVDLLEVVCLCDLCFAINGKCICEECMLKEECVKGCDRNIKTNRGVVNNGRSKV
jgi:hypothetical protein